MSGIQINMKKIKQHVVLNLNKHKNSEKQSKNKKSVDMSG